MIIQINVNPIEFDDLNYRSQYLMRTVINLIMDFNKK